MSVASVDSLSIESLFSREILQSSTGAAEFNKKSIPYELLQNRPNPFDESTIIGVKMNNRTSHKKAKIVIHDIQGKTIKELPINLDKEVNEVIYEHGYGKVGIYSYSLIVDDKIVTTKQMIFAN